MAQAGQRQPALTMLMAMEREAETLEDVNRRTHDRVAAADLHKRADELASRIESYFSVGFRPANVLEIGSGVCFIIEVMARRFPRAKFTGLDISQSMIDKAKARLRADAPSVDASFLLLRTP
jgi:ubiquinone/menaquinone biosynthesis C-methylase UbiE